jgi:hypothetical protein
LKSRKEEGEAKVIRVLCWDSGPASIWCLKETQEEHPEEKIIRLCLEGTLNQLTCYGAEDRL